MITDEQTITAAHSRFGHAIPVYDDGFGPLWIHRDSMGISGVVRAQTWEDAYSICEDEFFPAADEEAAADWAELDAMPENTPERAHAEACWDEAYGYRPNGARREKDGTASYIYARDLNGDCLERLTPALAAELEITLTLEPWS